MNMICDSYKWKKGSRISADAAVVGKELEELKEHGSITPPDVIIAASDESSELHKCFTWSNKKAGGQYRLQQARAVLNSIVYAKVTIEEVEVSDIRVYTNVVRSVADEDGEHKEQSYESTVIALQTEDTRAIIIDEVVQELRASNKKMKQYQAIVDAFTPDRQEKLDDLIEELV